MFAYLFTWQTYNFNQNVNNTFYFHLVLLKTTFTMSYPFMKVFYKHLCFWSNILFKGLRHFTVTVTLPLPLSLLLFWEMCGDEWWCGDQLSHRSTDIILSCLQTKQQVSCWGESEDMGSRGQQPCRKSSHGSMDHGSDLYKELSHI